ncbi:MAG: potassium channel protein [Ignavibacteriae bacterium]|nr:potassium channel protein [Ignavibacteriota bacterium]MCB9215384.1 potassium channel protein [Ignavibacteria bacterium]
MRRFQISLLMLLMLVAGGTLGYILLEGMQGIDALYMTIITITTVGFGEVRQLSPEGRIFTILLIILGVGVGAWAIRNGVEIVLGDTLWHSVQQKKMNKIIKELSGHYIICGYGRIGRQIARDMALRNEPFVVIDQNSERIEWVREKNMLYVLGDATHDEMLIEAGIERAGGLVAALNSDADNVLAVLTARGLNPNLQIVARAGDETVENKLRRAGADRVVSPYAIGGHRLALAMLQPAVHDFFNRVFNVEQADVDIGEIPVLTSSPLKGKTIAECDLRNSWGLIVIGIRKTDGTFNISPDARHPVEEGETLIVIGPPELIFNYKQRQM